jgi:hypothetical protein
MVARMMGTGSMDMQAKLDERTAMPPFPPVAMAGLGVAPLFDLGEAERRLHARAYTHWVSLLRGRPFPSITDFDPATVAGFAAHDVLLDFTRDPADPAIVHLGARLREECAIDREITRVGQVPARSLLARLTDHHRQIIADRAPVGFEAEFVGARGRTMLYRGILMPLSSPGGDGIDYVYGVINWKEVADPAVQARLDVELGAVLAGLHEVPIWADGPHAAELTPPACEAAVRGTPAETLAAARTAAIAVHTADARRRAVLYRALGRAHDLAFAADRDPAAYARLTGGTPPVSGAVVVALVFGADHDPVQLAEWAAVLDHARRHAVPPGRMAGFIEGAGGIDAIVIAERRASRRQG